ncbi:MAG TPA: alpha/beta hydrolase [Nocardioides sp.]|nr:alpha/beta hydrolase [Nocardioides sp.]
MHVPSPVLRAVTRAVVRPVLNDRLHPRHQRRIIDALSRFPVLPTGTVTEARELGGRPALRITTPASDPQRALLFLHGGAYTSGSPISHRALAAHLGDQARAVGHLLDYRLAPEHPYPAAVDDALAAYRDLLASGIPAERIAVAGDSAGGGLTLALVVRIKAEGLPLPCGLALVSPWVDLALTGLDESVRDPLLTRGWLERSAQSYAGTDRARPEVSPIHADLGGFPPMVIQGSSDEILVADVERFVARAREAGVEVDYERIEGAWHDLQLYAGTNRDATAAVARLGAWLGTRFA